MDKTISERLRMVRSYYHLTQEQFGKKLNRKKSYISCVERGISIPSWGFLLRVAHEYNIRPEWLDTGDGAMLREQDPEEDGKMTVLPEP